MHAVSQEPLPCIYAQLEPASNDSNDEQDDSEEEQYPEIRLIPDDPNKCELPSLPHLVALYFEQLLAFPSSLCL